MALIMPPLKVPTMQRMNITLRVKNRHNQNLLNDISGQTTHP